MFDLVHLLLTRPVCFSEGLMGVTVFVKFLPSSLPAGGSVRHGGGEHPGTAQEV